MLHRRTQGPTAPQLRPSVGACWMSVDWFTIRALLVAMYSSTVLSACPDSQPNIARYKRDPRVDPFQCCKSSDSRPSERWRRTYRAAAAVQCRQRVTAVARKRPPLGRFSLLLKREFELGTLRAPTRGWRIRQLVRCAALCRG